jgi:hypothetical protein
MKYWVCYKPGNSKGWPQSFPTFEAAEAFMEENGWAEFVHVVVSTADSAMEYLPGSGS